MIIYEDVFSEFRKKKIGYVIVGGIAANLLGMFRSTADLDILIDVARDNIVKVDALLRSLGYKIKQPLDINKLDKSSLAKLIKARNLKAINYYKPGELKEVDIIVDSPVSFSRARKKAKKISVGKFQLPVISIEDLITMKRNTGRAVDEFDVTQLERLKRLVRK